MEPGASLAYRMSVCLAAVTCILGPHVAAAELVQPAAASGVPAPSPMPVAPSPLSLDQALALAMDHSPVLKIAAENYRRATGAVTEARGATLPGLTITGAYIRNDQKTEAEFPTGPPPAPTQKIPIQPLETKQAKATLSQPLDISGLLGASVDAARYSQVAAEADLAAARHQLALNVRSSYLHILQAREQRGVSQDAVDRLKEYLRLAKVRVDAGSAPKFDVIRAQTELVNAEQTLLAAQNAVRLAEVQLASVMGVRLAQDPVLDTPDVAEKPLPALEALVEQAQKQRPEAVSDKAAVMAAERGIHIARRGLRPGMRVDGNVNWNGTTTAFNNRQFTADLMLSVSVPIFDSGITRGRVEQARAIAGATQAASEQTAITIRMEVEQACLNIENALKRLKSANANVTQAREGLRLANVRYESGVSTEIEVTDAQLALTEAQTNLVNARYDLLIAYARLARATADQGFAAD